MSLVARALEQSGIATVIMGSARDIVEYCGVPRFLFSDYPLGNPCGRPFDTDNQRALLDLALDLLEQAEAPRTTRVSPFTWAGEWKDNFMHVGEDNRAELEAAGEARRAAQQAARERG